MSVRHLGCLLLLAACGGGTGETPRETTAGSPTGDQREAEPPRDSACNVIATEEGGETRTTRYAFRAGVLSEVVVTDGVSGRSFTTRYTWDHDRRTVRVEKLAEGQDPRPPLEMRYAGTRESGEIVGEHVFDESLLQRVTWHYDAEDRPVRRDQEWLPSPEERAAGVEPRVESDACSYDGAGRPATFELSLEGEPVLLIFYTYDGAARYPRGIVEKHLVGPEVPPRDNTIAEVDTNAQLRVTWPGEGEHRITRYEGECEPVFFPAVCSSAAAPQ
jgi:hypothetical protein